MVNLRYYLLIVIVVTATMPCHAGEGTFGQSWFNPAVPPADAYQHPTPNIYTHPQPNVINSRRAGALDQASGPGQPGVCPNDLCLPAEGWFDNLTLFGGIDGAKQPQDLGVNANLGGRFSANWGIPVWRDQGLGVQVGVGYVFAQNAVAVLERLDGTNNREQLFTTLGLFQRLDRWNWSLVYDVLVENYYDNFALSQVRGRTGYQWNETNEFGTWFAVHTNTDSGLAAGTPVRLKGIDQVNFFWQHLWKSGANTNLWLGAAASHSDVVYVFPENTRTAIMPVLGASINVPLNDYLAIFGETNLIMPADSGTVDAYLGFAFYPGGGSFKTSTNRFNPVLPVASSPSFGVDMAR